MDKGKMVDSEFPVPGSNQAEGYDLLSDISSGWEAVLPNLEGPLAA